MNNKKSNALRAAVIGNGKISEEHLGFLRDSPQAQLVGVCDLSPALASFASDQFNAEHSFTDCEAMLAALKPDVLHVLTPPQTHVNIVRQGLLAGAHVIVEKPVAPTYEEFDKLWMLSQETGRYLIEDHNYRFNPIVQKLENLVADGVIGEVVGVDVLMVSDIRSQGRYADANMPHPSHQLPAGAVHEFVTHLAYLTLLFLPSFEQVSACWSNHGGGNLFKYDSLDAVLIGGAIHARIRFDSSGATSSFIIAVRGTGGTAQVDIFHPHLTVSRPRAVGPQLSPLLDQVIRGFNLIGSGTAGFWRKLGGVTPYQGLHLFLEETYQALLEGREPPVTYSDMERASALVESLITHRGFG